MVVIAHGKIAPTTFIGRLRMMDHLVCVQKTRVSHAI